MTYRMVETATKATDRIQDRVSTVFERLNGDFNGYGINLRS